jgi:hypothetical protein
MANQEPPTGWHHVAATRAGNSLKIFVDGQQVAENFSPEATAFNLSNKNALQIGFGPNDHFYGRLSSIHLYGRALTMSEIVILSKK